MNVIPREICRDPSQALAHEWLLTNGTCGYAAGTISGALTRREHGLLVTAPNRSEWVVMLAKVDEEIQIEGQLYKLGTDVYQNNIINPDGFLYLQQVTFENNLPTFWYEAGRFRLSKTVWLAAAKPTLYIRYTLGDQSSSADLTLVPLCDSRPTHLLTRGREDWHFGAKKVPYGLEIRATEQALPYSILTQPQAAFTELDLWYWHFELRAEKNMLTDLYMPGLLRAHLRPGQSLTLVATAEPDAAEQLDAEHAWQQALARPQPLPLAVTTAFTPELLPPLPN